MTDDERNRYGSLLDPAAERGLLSPTEYQARLAEVAEATSVDELQRIVTELPAFGAPSAAHRGRPGGAAGARRPPTGGAARRTSTPSCGPAHPCGGDAEGEPWLVLAVVVGVLLVALVALGLVAAHVTHTHGRRTRPPRSPAGSVPFASEELLELGGDLVAAGQVEARPSGVALLGVDRGLEPPDHLDVVGVGADQLVDLAA